MAVNSAGRSVCLHRAWQSLPTASKPFSFVTQKSAARSVPGMKVTMMMPKFSPAKILENIIFSLRFKTPEEKKEGSTPAQSGENEAVTEAPGNACMAQITFASYQFMKHGL